MKASSFALMIASAASSLSAPRAEAAPQKYAFAGRITQGSFAGMTLSGGLTIVAARPGPISGVIYLADGIHQPVQGSLGGDSSLTISFPASLSNGLAVTVTGQGRPDAHGLYRGTFRVTRGPTLIDLGVWAASPVARTDTLLGLAFDGTLAQGPDHGRHYSGAVLIDVVSNRGTLTTPDGQVDVVTLSQPGLLGAPTYALRVNLGDGTSLQGQGAYVPSGNGYLRGTFAGPAPHDAGAWTAPFFRTLHGSF